MVRTEFQAETVAREAWEDMQVSMEDLLTGGFSVGHEQVYALATNATRSEGRGNARPHYEDVTS